MSMSSERTSRLVTRRRRENGRFDVVVTFSTMRAPGDMTGDSRRTVAEHVAVENVSERSVQRVASRIDALLSDAYQSGYVAHAAHALGR